MKIGINALYLIPGRVGGSEIYLRRLISALSRIDRENEYIVFTNRENSGSFDLGDNFREHHCPVRALIRPHRIAWEQLVLPYRARQHNLNVLHSPGFVAPLFSPCPSVITILDLIYLEFPETFPFAARTWMRFLVRHSARRARAIIALSRYSRDEILWALDIPFWKIKAIYMGGGEDKPPQIPREERNRILHKAGIVPPFILTVAAAHPHKNLMRLLEAYYQLLKEEKRYQLVIVGVKHNRYYQKLVNMLERLNLRGRVVFTGWIPEREKECIYNEARLLVFPSLLEGFGLPILESMRCGLPVACSELPSLAEVAGEAACLFNPYSVEDITRTLLDCLSNDDLRRRLIARGRIHAEKFNWEETAWKTLEVYREAAGLSRQNRIDSISGF
ncbi:MAG: glycosyltransferase family 1 protein [Candidatus Euphemobacter frigidus]|nr:glycosyltransferase family 1 protein [Candidatus Euphemobacter frigidus]MDP8276372.1 glycosyltransferase family 1 protein [Candidatus Euphemobacter frigidus]